MPTFSPALLNHSSFYSLTSLEVGDVNDVLLSRLILSLNKLIDRELGDLFVLQPNYTKTYQPKKSNRIFAVDAWQATDLSLSVISNDNSVRTLSKSNYILYKDYSGVVYGVILSSGINESEELQLTGTFGYSDGLPFELESLDIEIYKLLKDALLEEELQNETGGRGEIRSARIGEVSTTFGSENQEEKKEKTIIANLPSKIKQILSGIKSNYIPEMQIAVIG